MLKYPSETVLNLVVMVLRLGNRELVCRREGPRTEIVPIGYILHVDIDSLNTAIEIGTSQQLRQKLIDKGQGCKGSDSRSSIISRFCKETLRKVELS
jgi:hypothetical protein